MDPSIDHMIERAYGQLKEGYFEDAAEAFSECLLLEPNEARAYYGRGMARFQLKEWPLAVSDFKKAQEFDPENLENWVALATSLAADDKIYEAVEVFEALLANHPQYTRGHIQLAQLYYRLGVITKGHRQLDAALASRPSLDERRLIEQLKKEQLTLDKKRYYRPDFEALRQKTRASSSNFREKIKNLFRKRT